MRIETNPQPQRSEVVPGVFFTLRPLSGPIMLAAEAETRRVISEITSGIREMAEWGLDVERSAASDGTEWLSTLLGLSVFIRACFLAEQLLIAWEGIEDEDGAPLEISRDAIRAALKWGEGGQPILLTPFLHLIEGPRSRRAAEKNVSGLSPSGFSAGASNTAKAVETSEPSAPGADMTPTTPPVRKRSTRR